MLPQPIIAPLLAPDAKRAIARLTKQGGVSAAALERALSLSPGYLSKIRHGAVAPGEQLTILLALLARHPMLLRELGVPTPRRQRQAPSSGTVPDTTRRRRGGESALAFIRRVAPLLEARGVVWAVGGGVAIGLHGVARATADVDIFVRDRDREALALFREQGASVGATSASSFVVYPPSSRRTHAATDRVDVVFATREPLRGAVERATPMPLGSVEVPVLRAVDLCAAKLLSHGPHDAADAIALIEAGMVDVAQVRSVLAKVPRLPGSATAHARHHGDTSAARERLRRGARGSPRPRKTRSRT